jgi:hypothetical protein
MSVAQTTSALSLMDEHDEHGLRKVAFLVFRTEPRSNDAISDHKTELNSFVQALGLPHGGSGMNDHCL